MNLLALVFMALANVAVLADNFVEGPAIWMSPDVMRLSDIHIEGGNAENDEGAFFSVQMTKEVPEGINTIVRLEASNGIKLSACSLQFNASNWNITQKVYADTVPQYAGDVDSALYTQEQLVIRAWINDPRFAAEDSQSIHVTRDLRQAKSARGSGDPHYVTFDGLPYDVCTFFFLKSIVVLNDF